MHFIKDDSIREWTMASDVVISSMSTSLVDAAVARKPAYLIEPYPTPEYLHSNWYDYITHIRTQEEFKSVCLNDSTAADNSQLANWARTELLGRGDAIWNLADFVARLTILTVPFI